MTYYFIYAIVLGCASVYSYVLLDPNITFLNHPLWTVFRDMAVQIGYHQRPLSTVLYIAFVGILTIFHWWTIHNEKKVDPIKTALLIGVLLTFSYPFLSHDFFNYMFDAKILTTYHQNPYLHAALDYPSDTWLRFMHWIHRPYPYGPVFLAITVVPAFLGMGKFIIHFFALKFVVVLFYIATVYFLNRMDKKFALIYATQPLVIIEGLISSHNEIFAVALGIMGLYYMSQNKGVLSMILLICSAAVKFMSFPFLAVERYRYSWLNYASLVGMIAVLLYAAVKVEVQPWYFLNLFFYLPIFPELIKRLQIFFAGLLLSYYPYMLLGGWDSDYKIDMKHWIVWVALILNGIYLAYVVMKKKKGWRFLLSETWSLKEHT